MSCIATNSSSLLSQLGILVFHNDLNAVSEALLSQLEEISGNTGRIGRYEH